MNLRIFSPVILLLLSGCNLIEFFFPFNATITPPESPIVIFTADQAIGFSYAADYAVGNQLADPEGYWTPSNEDIEELEPISAQEILNQPLLTEASLTLDSYNRQYFGFSVNDEKYIYASYFCAGYDYDFDWQNYLIFVMDGGSCFIDLVYNYQTKQMEWFYIHGEA